MRIVPSLLASLAAVSGFIGTTAARAETPRAKIMIVGVAHLVARHDVHNSAFTDDPLGPKRQAQIADVVARLVRFAPTKVLIEDQRPAVAEQYKAFRTGAFALPAGEEYQFGFRLAAAAGNATIYPIDNDGPELIDDRTPIGRRMMDVLKQTFATDRGRDPSFDEYIDRQAQIERTGTYLDLLRFLNTDAAIRANASSYSVLDGIGRDVNYAGAAYVAGWYGRNCYIFANILSVTAPGDRVAVIIGQGHEYLLRELARLNPSLEDVDPLVYLK